MNPSVVTTDADGRFSFEDLDEGFGQLSFHPLEDESGADDGQNAVVTPLFQL